MFLETLRLNDFRSFQHERICFSKGLTVFVGENNSGKSNGIDALRLLTAPLSGRRELYCEPTDIRFGSMKPKFELEATFAELSLPQQGRFISAVTDHTLKKALFGLSYDASGKLPSVRPNTWAGHLKSTPEPGCAEMIRHVYLPPLRDARRALASGNPTRLYALLKHFLGDDDEKALADRLKRDTTEKILTEISTAVDVGLTALTAGIRRQVSSLGFNTDEALIDVARDLRFKLADHGIKPEDLRYTGHGYANLLYIATIAVELDKVKNTDLTLFLVEEPEAHLHPQLQAAVLCFLEERAEKPRPLPADYAGPAGQLQVIVATHSPNLSAWVSSKKMVFFRSASPSSSAVIPIERRSERAAAVAASGSADVHAANAITKMAPAVLPNSGIAASAQEAATAAENTSTTSFMPAIPLPDARRVTRCIPLSALALDDRERRKIDRYLDVTKSALMFGGRVLLVEGIAEALLLPVIARMHVLKGDEQKLRTFRSTVFVPIEGVDFECYLRLLLSTYNEIRIADRVVIITDGDRTGEPLTGSTPGERRKAEYEKLASDLGAKSIFDVVVNTYSLETELVNAGNASLMKRIYLKLHPNSESKWAEAIALDGDAKANAIQALFKKQKGDFAQLLAEAITEAPDFNVPVYIRTALGALVQ